MKIFLAAVMLIFPISTLADDFEFSTDPSVYDDADVDYSFIWRSKQKRCNSVGLNKIMNPQIFFGGLAMVNAKENYLSNFVFCKPINGDDSKVVKVFEAITGPAVDKYRLVDPRQALSLNNLRGVGDMKVYDEIQKRWAKFWAGFEKSEKEPTLEQVFKFAHSIDKEFGHKYLPPLTSAAQ